MSPGIVIGPLAIPASLLIAGVSMGVGWWLSERLARGRALAIAPFLYLVLGMGLVAARAAFVLEYRSAYADAPLSILNIRDGGWSPVAGFLAAAMTIAVLLARRSASGKPLAAGWGVAALIWAAGVLATAILQQEHEGLPPMTLASLDGTDVSIADLRGRPVVLNLWASWCPPCRREMPVLQQAQQRRHDVQFVFVNQGEPASRIAAFLGAAGLDLRNVLLDPHGQVALQFGQRALPATLFFDARGQLVATRVGELSPATLAERLDALPPQAPNNP